MVKDNYAAPDAGVLVTQLQLLLLQRVATNVPRAVESGTARRVMTGWLIRVAVLCCGAVVP